MLVSDVQQSDSVIHVTIIFQILFPFKLLQSIEQSSLCYTMDPYWLFILNIAVCLCQSKTLCQGRHAFRLPTSPMTLYSLLCSSESMPSQSKNTPSFSFLTSFLRWPTKTQIHHHTRFISPFPHVTISELQFSCPTHHAPFPFTFRRSFDWSRK